MKCFIRHFFTLTMLLVFAQGSFAQVDEKKELCQSVLDWIYKDLTVNNLDKSIDRTKRKLLAAVISTLKNHKKGNLKHHPELAQLWKSMKQLDPEFESYLQKNKPYKKLMKYTFFDWIAGDPDPEDIETLNFFKVVDRWKNLQRSKPEYFNGLDPELRLDDWDITTSKLVDRIGNLNHQDKELTQKIKNLSKDLKSLTPSEGQSFEGKDLGLNKIKNQVDQIQSDIKDSIIKIFNENFGDYSQYCSKEDFTNLLTGNTNYCPVDTISSTQPLPSIKVELNKISDILNTKDLNGIFKPEKPIIDIDDPTDQTGSSVNAVDQLCPIKIDYFKIKKPSKKATYNMRGSDIVDTIVIHHTGEGTKLTTNAEVIHKMHVNRSTRNSPWYMVGYNYIVSLGGNGSSIQSPAIIEGRNPSFRGAHAGGDTLPLAPKNLKKLFNTFQYYNCKEDLRNKVMTPSAITKNNICSESFQPIDNNGYQCADLSSNIADINNDGSLSGNMTSIGIAVMGNFSDNHVRTFRGTQIYSAPKINVASIKENLIPKLVDLINALKKEYPNLKKVVPHNYFKATECPGTIQQILGSVAAQTGLEVYLSKSEEFERKKLTDYKHLRKVVTWKAGRRVEKYVYKSTYQNLLNITKEIKRYEKTILDIKTDIFLNNRSESYKQNEIEIAQRRLTPLYSRKDEVLEDLNL